MGVRSTGRKLAMQIVYQADIRHCSVDDILIEFFKNGKYSNETMTWAITLSKASWAYKSEADILIKKYSVDWDISRINPIDKSILRIAFYELSSKESPIKVILNEAIEISKKYSTDDSPKFINGILGAYVEKKK